MAPAERSTTHHAADRSVGWRSSARARALVGRGVRGGGSDGGDAAGHGGRCEACHNGSIHVRWENGRAALRCGGGWLAAAPTSRPSLSPRARCDAARRVDRRSPSPALVLLTHTSHTHTHIHSNPYIAKLEELDAAAAACTGAESLTLPLCFVARGDFERPEERDPQLQLTDLAKHCERSAQWDARVAEQFDVVAAALEGGSELTTRERYS